MLVYDKQTIKEQLTLDNVYSLCEEWGGEPEYCPTGLTVKTICHNHLNDNASRKLYYYENTGLFRCDTGCDEPVFDIFQLCIKVMNIQHNIHYDLNDAIRWIARYFGFSGVEEEAPEEFELDDWKILANYSRIKDIQIGAPNVILKEYDDTILSYLNYNVKITPWLKEGISQQVLDHAEIGFYPGGAQITIPHFDKNGNFIGLRGRSVVQEEAERFGKYRPVKINGQIYNHPLGLNLYNFNNARCIIPKARMAVIFEGEKSVLKAQTYFGFENDIYVACCGSSISSYQIQLLIDAGAQEIIIAFDRQFQHYGDKEYFHLIKNLKKITSKYKNYVNISCIIDKWKLTGYKSAPIDHGPDIFLKLFKERINLS